MTRGRSFARAVVAALALCVGLFAFSGSAWAVGERKAGPWMFNLKIGPAIDIDAPPGDTQFALEAPEIGYALDHANNAYLTFSPQFEFSSNLATILLPIGFQYDIEIPKVTGLFVYPKINVGGAIFAGNFRGRGAQGAFLLQPAIGIKYNLVSHFHIGFEPFSMPFYLGNKYDKFGVQYQLYFYGGVDI